MKLTSFAKTLATAVAVAITSLGHSAQAKENIPGVAEQPAAYFYTGKPYDSDLGSYTFNARNYNPEINRWTSADPSGFPDGANSQIYAATPTSEIDLLGLSVRKIYTYGTSYFSVSWDVQLDISNGPTLNNATASGINTIATASITNPSITNIVESHPTIDQTVWTFDLNGTINVTFGVSVSIAGQTYSVGPTYNFPTSTSASYTFE